MNGSTVRQAIRRGLARFKRGAARPSRRGTLKQTRPPERSQAAFKDSMIHKVMQFTPVIALYCVLHRYESPEIHC